MAQSTIALSSFLNNGSPIERACENCRFWQGDWSNKTFDSNGNWIGQCSNEADDSAPYAGIERGIVLTFTGPDCCCAAFDAEPELVTGHLAEVETLHRLDNELTRSAWV